MEIKARFDFRKLVILFYAVCFVIYLIIGLTPAAATNYEISAEFEIPAIGLKSDVTKLTLENNRLETPDSIIGSYSRAENKTLLIGHSSTVFGDLDKVIIGDFVTYNSTNYLITDIVVENKEDISMRELLSSTNTDTLILMTCAGTDLGNGDATHRLIITAEAISSLNE